MAKTGKKKVLIIEDEKMLLDALVEDFIDSGYLVFPCVSAEQAFEQMKEVIPDIILTDLVLYEVDGFEIMRILKENIHWSQIPVMVISNLSEPEDQKRARSLGAVDYLVKAEMSLEQIVNKVKAQLEKE